MTSTCAGCNKAITGTLALSVNVDGKRYHTACFKCSKCQSPLKEYFEHQGKYVCGACLNPGVVKSGACKACGRAITGPFISAFNFKWHNECLVCHVCKESIPEGSGFYDDDVEKPVHLQCLDE